MLKDILEMVEGNGRIHKNNDGISFFLNGKNYRYFLTKISAILKKYPRVRRDLFLSVTGSCAELTVDIPIYILKMRQEIDCEIVLSYTIMSDDWFLKE
jgi:hypothetical protein